MKTIKQWLSTLPEGIRELSLESYDGIIDKTNTLSDAIAMAFSWGNNFDWDFWNAVYTDAIYHEENKIPV